MGCGLTERFWPDPEHLRLAKRMEVAADDCLLAVRDGGQLYDDAPTCVIFRVRVDDYFASGAGFSDADSVKVSYLQARAVAWSAVAASLAKECDLAPPRVW